MERSTKSDTCCLFCEEDGVVTLGMEDGNVVHLCPMHWAVWHEHSQKKKNVEPVYDD